MRDKKHNNTDRANRRRFISNTIKLTLLGSILAPLEQACSNNKLPEPKDDRKEKKSSRTGSKKSRTKWHHESLVLNTKSNVMHLPTRKMYAYYDEINSKHLKEISLAAWTSQLDGQVRMHKEQSGNITEMLTL